MKKPKPKHTKTVCDVCGLDWRKHGKEPTIEKCVELLKAEVKRISYRPQLHNSASASIWPGLQIR